MERYEDGAPEILDLQKCKASDGGTFLCSAGCMEHFSFVCDDCGKRFCHVDAVVVEDRHGSAAAASRTLQTMKPAARSVAF